MISTTRELQLQNLYADLRKDPHYRSRRMGSIFVPGVGNPHSPVVLVGEAPGREEEQQGLPFVGRAGQNLNALLDHVGWVRDQLFITNLVKYRPLSETGGNRKPSRAESRHALEYLLRELTVLDSRWVICLGSSAAAAILGRPGLKMLDANGKVLPWNNRKILVTYHPSPLNFNNPHRRQELFKSFQHLQQQTPFVGTDL